jgi:hypothetical protein
LSPRPIPPRLNACSLFWKILLSGACRKRLATPQDIHHHGCQMVCFQTKNPNLGKFWRVLLCKILVYFMTIWSSLRPLEIFYGNLVHFVEIGYIFPRFWYFGPRKIWQPCIITSTRYLRWSTYRSTSDDQTVANCFYHPTWLWPR